MTDTKGTRDRLSLADEARRAAADMNLACRRLTDLTAEPGWKPKLITGPLRADLTDVYGRIGALLRASDRG